MEGHLVKIPGTNLSISGVAVCAANVGAPGGERAEGGRPSGKTIAPAPGGFPAELWLNQGSA